MATAEFSASAGTTQARAGAANAVGAIASAGTLATAVNSAVATLVADGASPTQAHVTTLNTAWSALKTALDAPASADMTVYIGSVSNIGDMNVLRQMWRMVERVIAGSGVLNKGAANPRAL